MEILPGDLSPRERFGVQNERYPWDTILDGLQRRLTRGEDFDCSSHAFRSMAYERAAARGLKVHSKISKDGRSLRLQAYRPGAKASR